MAGYYGPSFAGIESGWYRTTDDPNYALERARLDSLWSDRADATLKSYVLKYGTFFSAFAEHILRDIEQHLGRPVEDPRYYSYYLANRVLELPGLRAHWIADDARVAKDEYQCEACENTQPAPSVHPYAIALWGVYPPYCMHCLEIVGLFRPGANSRPRSLAFWSEDLQQRFTNTVRSSRDLRNCDLCARPYRLGPQLWEFGHPGGSGTFAVPFVYPNMFACVCFRCFRKATSDNKRGTRSTQSSRLYALYKFLGKVPTEDFTSLFYLSRDHEYVVGLTHALKGLRTPEGLKSEFGSFFGALVEAGVFPSGSRKMRIGTMTVAEDGHVCLSIPERDIDDYLHRRGIKHSKEVRYPDSLMRADWELHLGRGRVFVEYFGLMSRPDYAEKAADKRLIAQENHIELVELFPESDPIQVLGDWIDARLKKGLD